MDTKFIEKKLQLFIVTYNRKSELQNTLEKIFSISSPLRRCMLTVLDNCSTDGTTELLMEYCKIYNIRIIRHPSNIGGNANIALAFMEAQKSNKEYTWILCDDDDFDFTYFSEIENAMEQKKDVILTTWLNDYNKITSKNLMEALPRKIWECCFLPGFLFATKNIDSDCLQNIFYNIYQSMPHMALIASIVNRKGDIFVPKHKIVIHNVLRLENSFAFLRSFQPLSKRLREFDLYTAYINTFQLINEEKIRYKIIEYMLPNKSFWSQLKRYIGNNKIKQYNFSDLIHGYSFYQKIRFFIYIIIPKFYIKDGSLNIIIFNKKIIRFLKKKNR